jgi:hypothetical protein
LAEGKFPPNYSVKLTITSNSKGEVSTRIQLPQKAPNLLLSRRVIPK